jgi:hypothetical protein
MISYTLFLDDVRNPTDECHRSEDVRIARSSQQAIDLVSLLGIPSVMMLDYHLGDMYPTTKRFIMWLRRQHLDGHLDLNKVQKVIIHSSHPTGPKELKEMWDDLSKTQLTSGVLAELAPRYDNY